MEPQTCMTLANALSRVVIYGGGFIGLVVLVVTFMRAYGPAPRDKEDDQ